MDIINYEAHITIEPVFDERFIAFERCAAAFKFKPAELLMQKSRIATTERSNKDSFCTGHSFEFADILSRTVELVAALEQNGFKVWRYKIEGIVLDVRRERLITIKEAA